MCADLSPFLWPARLDQRGRFPHRAGLPERRRLALISSKLKLSSTTTNTRALKPHQGEILSSSNLTGPSSSPPPPN